jgi:hypothetical protein
MNYLRLVSLSSTKFSLKKTLTTDMLPIKVSPECVLVCCCKVCLWQQDVFFEMGKHIIKKKPLKKFLIMAKKIFAACMAAFAGISSVVLFTACTDVESGISLTSENEQVVDKTTSVVAEVEHSVTDGGSNATDNMNSSLTVVIKEDDEVVGEVPFKEQPTMTASLKVAKSGYNITEDLLESMVIGSRIERTLSATAEKDTVVLDLNDGQQLVLPVSIDRPVINYADYQFSYGTDSLIAARLVSAVNTDVVATRATYVSQTVDTKYVVELTFKEINTLKDTTFNVTLSGVARRYILSEDEIASVSIDNKDRVVIDDTTEKLSFDKVLTMKSGEQVVTSKSMILNRLFKGIDTYDKTVSDFAYSLAKVNGVSTGSESFVRSESCWSVYGKKDSYSANISNGVSAEGVVTSYSLYHERATYKDDDITVEFGYETVNVSENKTNVVAASSDKSGYDKKVLSNEVSTSYIGYAQKLSEQVNLYKVAKAVESAGWDESSASVTVSDDAVKCSIDWVIRYNTGETEKESYSKSFARTFKCTSNWSSVEDDASQTTGAATTTLKSAAKADGYWKWNEETRTISTVAKLAGSEQTNSWTAVDPNAISLTRESKTYSFGTFAFAATNAGATVTKNGESNGYDVYSYADKLNVTFGSNSKSSTATGTIKVEQAVEGDFPAEWGKFVKAVATCSINEAGTDWVYVWSLHFENGTLPVILRKDDTAANINQSLYENYTDTRLNSASYISGKWINSIATDEKNVMSWTGTAGNSYNMIQYSTSTMWKWNYGKNSVFTDKFSFAIENGGKVLVVKKDGNVFATYRATVK